MDLSCILNQAVAFSIGSVDVRWYGIIISLGMAIGIILAYKEAQRQKEDPDHLFNILIILIPAVIIGARLYYVIFNWSYYADHLSQILTIWNGGLAIHGGIIAGLLVLLIYCRKKKLDILRWIDILIPSLVLGQAIGRWGNFANQEAYGAVIPDGSFWEWVPLQVIVDGVPHHPTFLYESLWNFAIFIFLMIYIRRPHRIGSLFALYLILYSLARFFIEGLRMDSLYIGELRVAQVISLIGIAVGIVLIVYLKKKRPIVDVTDRPELAENKTQAKPKKRKKRNNQTDIKNTH